MFLGKRIAVVVPAYNEADKIGRTIRSVPGYVDHVVVVDDGSFDATAKTAGRSRRRGLEVIQHADNAGVGAALLTGYQRALALGSDVVAVMAGDSQMDPVDLSALVAAVAAGRVDYAKGNRFAWPGGVLGVMPPGRLLGNLILSWLTRLASGLWHVFDSQCGYTAANRTAIATLLEGPLFPRYGYPNDALVRLALAGARVRDIPVRPVYGPQWRSGIRPVRVIIPILRVLARGWVARVVARLRRAGRVGGVWAPTVREASETRSCTELA